MQSDLAQRQARSCSRNGRQAKYDFFTFYRVAIPATRITNELSLYNPVQITADDGKRPHIKDTKYKRDSVMLKIKKCFNVGYFELIILLE